MTLYECLGIDPFLMNETIPADMIIDNIDQGWHVLWTERDLQQPYSV